MNREALLRYVDDLRTSDSRDSVMFCLMLNRGIALLALSDEAIADRLSVSRPTIALWKRGKNLPHWAVRPSIYEWLLDQTIAAIGKP
jgi:hypothetical protein